MMMMLQKKKIQQIFKRLVDLALLSLSTSHPMYPSIHIPRKKKSSCQEET